MVEFETIQQGVQKIHEIKTEVERRSYNMSNNNESAKKLSAKLFAAYETERAMKWLHGQNKEFAEKYPAGTPQPEQGETYWIIKNLLNIISDLKATSGNRFPPPLS